MKEIFKDIAGYEGLYQVSNLGRVKSLGNNEERKDKILKPGINHGYCIVELSKNNNKRKFSIHRLVAESFLDNPNKLPQVNHIDQNKQNNRVDNLEYCTSKYNIRYSKARPVGCFNNEILIKYYNAIKDTEKDGFNIANVCLCCQGKKPQYKGFQWKYLS